LLLPAARKRKLDGAGDGAAETDEQLARRLHEELNALNTRHARRGGPQQQQLQRARSAKSLDSTKVGKPKQQQHARDEDEEQQQDAKQQPARKRSVASRELAMLATNMVAAHAKSTRQGGEQEQQHPAIKHESSSSQSEQERLALEGVQAGGGAAVAAAAAAAAGVDAKPQANKQQRLDARVSGVGAAGVGAIAQQQRIPACAFLAAATHSNQRYASATGPLWHPCSAHSAKAQCIQQQREHERSLAH
jgi:hypothetical protein